MADLSLVRTSHDYPPIPIRTLDWSAWIDGFEEDGPYGHGKTEAEAIADLREALEERCRCGNNGGGDCQWCQIRWDIWQAEK